MLLDSDLHSQYDTRIQDSQMNADPGGSGSTTVGLVFHLYKELFMSTDILRQRQ
jgi:hypothetical protein